MRKPIEFTQHPADFPEGVYRAHCIYVVDGDTYDFLVDLGFLQYTYLTVRLRSLDTPEIFRPSSEEERIRGQGAKARVEDLLLGKPAMLRPFKDSTTFGRFVADVLYWDGAEWKDLAETLDRDGWRK